MRLLIAAAVIAAMPALAQDAVKPADGVIVVPAADIARQVNAVPTSVTLTSTDKYSVLFSHRTVDGAPEQHANWTDVMVMLHGEVTLTTGGTITGNTVTDGESHGGTQTGGTTVTLHAGDYLRVPAGVPHRMWAPKDDFRYFVTKVHV